MIDFHRKEGTRGSFVLGPGRLAGKIRVMDFHTGEGGWSGKFCFGGGQVGRKNPGDGLPHQGGRVLGGIADVADTCLI